MFFFIDISQHIPFIYYAHEFQVSFDTITFDPTSISMFMVIFVIIVKFSRYLIVFSIIWLTKNRLVELLARWNSSNVYRVTNGGGEGREGDYQAQKLERASCSWFGWFFELVREYRAENYLFSAWPNCLPLFQVIIYTPWSTVNYTANYFRAPVDLITGFVIVEFLDRN